MYEASSLKFTLLDSPDGKDDTRAFQHKTKIILEYGDDGENHEVSLEVESWITNEAGAPDGKNDSKGECRLSKESLIKLRDSISFVLDHCKFRD